jgi:CubicO group peptidase (beta-lactamase class C family)
MKLSVFAAFVAYFFWGSLPTLAAPNAPPSIAILKTQANEITHALQAAELWIGGTVIVTNGTDTQVGIYGTRGPTNTGTPTGESHFEIGSVSKSFTGILLAWVVNQYPQVHLDDPIGNFAPKIQGAFARKITLRALANQVSGLSADFCINEGTPAQKCYLNPADPNNPYADYRESDLLAYLNAYTRPDPPPYTYVYSNPGFITLGYVLSQISRKPYEQLLGEVITEPLQMKDTLVNVPGASVADYLPGYQSSSKWFLSNPYEHHGWLLYRRPRPV